MADEQQQPAVDDAGQRPNKPVDEAAPQEAGDIQDPAAYYKAQAEKSQRLLDALNKKLSDIEKQKQAEEDAKALERGEHEQVIAKLKPKAERLEKLESVFQGMYERRLAQIPDDHRERISTLLDRIPAVEDKLDALDLQLELLGSVQPAKASAPNLNAGEGVTPSTKRNDDHLSDTAKEFLSMAKDRGFIRRKS